MLRHLILLFFFTASLLCNAKEWTSPHPLSWEEKAPAALIPFPQKVKWEAGTLPLPATGGWQLSGDMADEESVRVAWEGLKHDHADKQAGGSLKVRLLKGKNKHDEGYSLVIDAEGVTIRAKKAAGAFYGLQTLRQLSAGRDSLPFCHIADRPAFDYRGYMQDCGRNFRPIERLKKELDLAAQLKVNLFHWHLTDYPAWHIECKAYPQLNDPKHRTRDVNDTYSYDDIRDLFAYARARNISIIPELDMPGHSAYFERAFGFRMHTPEGMKIVGELLDEFCREIPADICPIIHFGADEVLIPNAAEFVDFVTHKLEQHGRTPMQWASSRDLPVSDRSIEQRWGEGADMAAKSIRPERITRKAFDSTMGYTNLLDPALLVRRYFFMRPCGVGKSDEKKLGTIMCIWPDGRVDDKTLIPGGCTMWPGMCAMAERAWQGGDADGDALPLDMPATDTKAGKAYSLFEQRMESLRTTLFAGEPFPVRPESGMVWTLVEPTATAQAGKTREAVLAGKLSGLKTRRAHGANLYFRTRPDTGYLGMYPGVKPGHTVWAITTIHAEEAGSKPFMIGFDAPARSNRRYTGVPKAGQWSGCGTRIFINGKEISNPRTYRLAGQKAHPGNAWNFENPLDREEIWWLLDPVELQLQKGDNTVIIEQPYIGEHQSWGISLIPCPQK